MAGNEVGMCMRQEHVAYLKPLLPGIFNIPIHVPLRIDYGGHAGALIGDEVRGVRQAIQIILLEDHRVLPA